VAWKKLVILCLLAGCVSTRSVDICVLSIPSDSASCAKRSKRYKLKVSNMRGWLAMDELSYQILGEKIAHCNVEGKLPKEDIFRYIEVCEIASDHVLCRYDGKASTEDKAHVDQWIATNESGLQKIKSKLDFCMR